MKEFSMLKKKLTGFLMIAAFMVGCASAGTKLNFTDPASHFAIVDDAEQADVSPTTVEQMELLCSDIYEPNDSKNYATPIQANQVYQALLANTLDVDYYTFTVTGDQPNVRLTLFNLPANYNIFFYDLDNNKIGSSKNDGLMPDTIIVNALVDGTYYVKVRAKAGNFNASNCYSFRAEASLFPFRLSAGNNAPQTDVQFDLYPNPVADHLVIQCDDQKISSATFSIYNMMNQQVKVFNHSMDINSKTTLDISDLSAGEYFLQINYGNDTEMKKFVISK